MPGALDALVAPRRRRCSARTRTSASSSRKASPVLKTPSVSACTGGSWPRGSRSARGCRLARYQFSAAVSAPGRARSAIARSRSGCDRRPLAHQRPVVAGAAAPRPPRTGTAACTRTAAAARCRGRANADGWPTESATSRSTRSGANNAIAHATAGAPVVADDVGLLDARVVEHREHVGDQMAEAVGVDRPAACRSRRSRAGRVQRRGNPHPLGSGSDGATAVPSPGSRGAGGPPGPRPRRAPPARRRRRLSAA